MEVREYHFIREGQPGSELFTFVVPAQDLLEFAKVERFNETSEGVERRLNYNQTLRLAEYMRTENASIPEPILGDLRGPWEFDHEKQVVRFKRGAKLLIDDGQHRISVLHLMDEEERGKWEFKVTATVNTPYQERLARFLQQTKRLKIDTQLILQLQDRGDLFPSKNAKVVYNLAKRLATEKDSPLFGLINLEERQPKKQPQGSDLESLKPILGATTPAEELRAKTVGMVNVTAIISHLQSACFSVHSVLLNRNPEQKFDAIVYLLQAAEDVWSEEWRDPKQYFLRRAEGINGLLQILVRGDAFKQCLRIPRDTSNKRVGQVEIILNRDAFKRVLDYGKDFRWSYQYYRKQEVRFPKPVEVAQQIDALIHKNRPRTRKQRAAS